ncbi:MAG: hypothetical protein IJL87_05625 [Clostridia bacterium]|nr:hypothetical protein [Clostridia bacterium]
MRSANTLSRKVMMVLIAVMLVMALFATSFVGTIKTPFDTGSVQKGPADTYRVIGYVTQWNWPGTDDPMVEGDAVADIDASKLTHINYAFGHIVNAQGSSYTSGFTGCVDVPDPDKLRALVNLKQQNPDLKVLLSVGGWGMDGFCPICHDATLTNNFVKSCVQIVKEYGLDGIDLDYEYPGTSGDKYDKLTCPHAMGEGGANESTAYADGEAYLDMFRAFRNNSDFGWNYLLTIASGVGYDWQCAVSCGEMGNWLDFINIMCYDLFGDWKDHSDYNANLYPTSTNPLSYDVVCKRLAMRGYPKDIMNIGIPCYGRERVMGKGDASWFTYDQVQDLLSRGLTTSVDPVTKASLATGTVDGRRYEITYDAIEDIDYKTDWIQSNGFGGAMFWEYSQDHQSGSPITKRIWNNLNGSGRKSAPPTPSKRYVNNTSYSDWKSYAFLADQEGGVFFQGKIYDFANTQYAGYHQGTYGWVPTFAPAYATSGEYYAAFPYANSYGAEWVVTQDLTSSTQVTRNESSMPRRSPQNGALAIDNQTPSAKYIKPGSSASWNVTVRGGTGGYTITNQIWFNGLKYDTDGYVKYEKRKTGGPYPNQGQGGVGETKSAISCTNASTSSATHTVTATFPTEGTYYVFTQVRDSSGNMAAQFSQAVTVTNEDIAFSVDSITADKTSFYYNGGETITWTASAYGATSYQFQVFKDGVSVATSASQASASYTYNVAGPGEYTCKVTASNGSETASLTGGAVTVLEIVPLQITSVTSTGSLTTGSTITFTANAKGGAPSYKYSYYFLKNGKVWYSNAYSYLGTCTFTPTEAGTYRMRTYVDDTEGTRVVYEKTVVIS